MSLADETIDLSIELAQALQDIADERDALTGDPSETEWMRHLLERWEAHYRRIDGSEA
jgi:hypothetical protein